MKPFGRFVTAGTVAFVLGLALIAGERPRLGIVLALALGAATALALVAGRAITRTRRRRVALCAATALVQFALAVHTIAGPPAPGWRWPGFALLALALLWVALAFRVATIPPGPTGGRVDDGHPFEI